MGGRSIVRCLLQMAVASTLMGLSVYYANAWLFDSQAPLMQRLSILLGEIVLGVAIYTGASRLMNNEELKFIRQLIRERRGSRPA